MAPTTILSRRNESGTVGTGDGDWRAFASDEDFILEGWSEGFMVGALVIMACITVANMRRGVLLHKLILVEQLAALSHGTFCFMGFRGYGWYLSSTATLLYISWIVHNIVAWMKIKPFFMDSRSMFKPETGKWVRRIYLGTLALTVPFICWQISNNFRFFNNINDFYVKRSPRFGILLCAICFSLIFTAVDIAASIHNFTGSTDGINPWWKLSLVFKCLTDTIMLDDFKTELKRLGIRRMRKEELRRHSFALVGDPNDYKEGDDQMEFSDALHTNPLQFQTTQNLDDSPRSSPMGRLRQDSITNSQSNEKEAIGKSGKKISKLPSLKDFSFASGGRKKVRIQDPEKDGEGGDSSRPAAPAFDRLADMRRSLGVIDYHNR
ncbi:hypothetical protein CLAIMM_07266 [Cladophialophora immunda]|nr:hypothetical protein CLAIMM_07266 [Cladophialophora immunda]